MPHSQRPCAYCGNGFACASDSSRRYCSTLCRERGRATHVAGGGGYKTGYYRGERYDSGLERAHMIALDSRGARWTKRHGIVIPYTNPRLRRRARYLPDFQVQWNGRTYIQEVKCAAFVQDEVVQAKAAAARAWCAARGFVYQFVTVAGQIGEQ